MSLKRKSFAKVIESSDETDFKPASKKTKLTSTKDATIPTDEKYIQLDNYKVLRETRRASNVTAITLNSVESSVDKFLDSLKRNHKTIHSLKREEVEGLQKELEATKKNLSSQLCNVDLSDEKEKSVASGDNSGFKHLKDARKEAKMSKMSLITQNQELANRQISVLNELSSLNINRETASFGQISSQLADASLVPSTSSLKEEKKRLNESVSSVRTTSSTKSMCENKWLKRMASNPPFTHPNLKINDSSSSFKSLNEAMIADPNFGSQANTDNRSKSLKSNFLSGISSPVSKLDITQNTLASKSKAKKVIIARRSNVQQPHSERRPSVSSIRSNKSRWSVSASKFLGDGKSNQHIADNTAENSIELTPITQQNNSLLYTPKISFTPNEKLGSRTKRNHSLNEKELEEYKSKLKWALSERANLEQKMKTDIEQQVMEKEQLKQELSKMKSELKKSEHYRKKLHKEFQEMRGNLRIFCRVKPVLDTNRKTVMTYPERLENRDDIRTRNETLTTIDLAMKDKHQTYFFDSVFDESTSQGSIFEAIKPFFQSALDGDLVSILAYGQTGSGKTFTLEGPNLRNDLEINASSGVLPRAVDFIFKEVERVSSVSKIEIYMAALEIYNETLQDLLAGEVETTEKGANAGDKLAINFVKSKLHGNDRVHVKGLKWIKIENNTQMLSLVAKASSNRSTDKTGWNDRSSRSHCIYQLKIVNDKDQEGLLNIVDLAGSERNDSQLPDNKVARNNVQHNKKIQSEANFINKSLTTLGRIVRMIAERKPATALPYRESKLTRLLQDSLGGNAKTLLFINVCPLEENANQSKESLKFSSKIAL